MPFSIQTNVNSLIAQENLRVNSNFQNQTIQRLTSGYRINSSGDDAAGLAIANKFRSDTAELAQGVRNANDGVAQLQIMDGGMNNISKMLDRLKTLATQSASGTFTGDRGVLNSEYQSLVTEIDRQAQGIGLSTGGHFAAKMGVYVGGGASAAGTADTANGTVSLDLTNSMVDTKALGLRTADFEVATAPGADIGAGSSTSVSAITTANNSVDSGMATFNVSGPGFSGVSLNVNITGQTSPQAVADQINAAIAAAGNTNTSFRSAGISASIKTASDGTQSLIFSSAGSAFQIQAGTATANALLGHFKTGTTVPGTGADVKGTFLSSTATTAAGASGAEAVKLQVTLNGTAHLFSVTISNNDNQATLLTDVTSATDGGGKTLAQLGVTVTAPGNKLQFVGPAATSMQVAVAGDNNNSLGLGTWQKDFATNSYASSGAGVFAAGTGVLEVSVNGGDKISIQLTDTSTKAAVAADITAAINNNATLKAAGLTAVTSANGVTFASSSSTNFRVNVASASAGVFDLKWGAAGLNGIGVSSTSSINVLPTQLDQNESSGAAQTGLGATNDVFTFKGLVNAGDQQTLSFNATDSTGAAQSTSITLTTTNAGTLDAAISAINTQLASNTTLKNVVAVKEMNGAGTAEGIRFISSVSSFSVKVGNATNYTAANPVGMYDGTAGATAVQGMTVNSSASGAMDISSITGAQQAVVALGEAVKKLGSAQAAIGKGQNQLNYAIGLAQSQISNFSAAESRIRDADVAAEAANLTKAQVLQQASMAAMAQANSAPQAVLSLLKG
jgi:flagellin